MAAFLAREGMAKNLLERASSEGLQTDGLGPLGVEQALSMPHARLACTQPPADPHSLPNRLHNTRYRQQDSPEVERGGGEKAVCF